LHPTRAADKTTAQDVSAIRGLNIYPVSNCMFIATDGRERDAAQPLLATPSTLPRRVGVRRRQRASMWKRISD
jgi:hypothetical protein